MNMVRGERNSFFKDVYIYRTENNLVQHAKIFILVRISIFPLSKHLERKLNFPHMFLFAWLYIDLILLKQQNNIGSVLTKLNRTIYTIYFILNSKSMYCSRKKCLCSISFRCDVLIIKNLLRRD